jgi:hypothetical protein
VKRSGLHPSAARPHPRWERQRVDAIEMVREKRAFIRETAATHRIAGEAIAAALLWDPLENPYRRPALRLGPGRVRPVCLMGTSEAEKVEAAGLLTPDDRTALGRFRRLRDPDWAIRYIAAIMRRHADNYAAIANVEIGALPAILCTLYQGGRSEARAKRFVARRARGACTMPVAGDEMGRWTEQHRLYLERLLGEERAETRLRHRDETVVAAGES